VESLARFGFPKVGRMWMRRGQQTGVETPRRNEKQYLGPTNLIELWWKVLRSLAFKSRRFESEE
jgi:hypothetical protein